MTLHALRRSFDARRLTEEALAADEDTPDHREPRQSSQDSLLLASTLKPEPPVALIKDDDPIDDDEPVPDRFGTSEIAERLARIVERMEPPYTISLSGSWGVGKTWVARRLRRLLKRQHIPVVEVDLWTQDIDELRRTLAVEVAVQLSGETSDTKLDVIRNNIADDLDQELRRPDVEPKAPEISLAGLRTRRTVITGAVAALLFALLWISLSQPTPPAGASAQPWVAPLISVVLAAFFWLLLQSGLVVSVTSRGSTLPPVREAVGLRKKFRTLITSHPDRKVLVVLDNLDRLTGEEAVKALGEVRSFVELRRSRCMFLVPLDRAALERHLERTMGGDDQAARDYLDKFFNLDLVLTNPAPADLRESVRGLLIDLFPDVDPQPLSLVAEVVAEAAGGSPRAAKRIANGIYARAYLLPPTARDRITLLDVAFVESLIARFSRVVPQLSLDLDRSLRRIAEVRAVTDENQRLSHLLGLLGEPYAPPAADDVDLAPWREERKRLVAPLEDFLLFTRAIEPNANVVRTVLTVRTNRQFGRVADPDEASAALRTGDTEALEHALGSLEGDDRHVALAALLDEVRTSLAQRWQTGARSGLNALAPVIVTDDILLARLRASAMEYLVNGDPDDFRALNARTIEILVPNQARDLPHGTRVADRATTSLGNEPRLGLPIVGAVRFVAATAGRLPAKKLEDTRAQLAKLNLSDDQLAPLYESGAEYRLLPGPVADLYVSRLTSFDASADLGPLELAAERLRFTQTHTDWDSAALLPVFDRVGTVLASGTPTEAWTPLVERVVSLTNGAEPQPQLDTFAQRVAGFAAGGRRSVELALAVPTTSGSMAPLITRQVAAMKADDFIAIATTQRTRLGELGVKVGEMAASRWAAGNGSEYLAITLPNVEVASQDTTFAGLAGVVDPGTYANLLDSLADRIVALESGEAAKRALADVASRVSTFGVSTVASLAPTIAKVQDLADPAPVVNAMETALKTMGRDEIATATGAAKSFVDADVIGGDALPAVAAAHGAALATVDLTHLNWLFEQPKVNAEHVVLGLRGAIGTVPHAKVTAALAAMSKTRRRRADIGKALVERAATEPVGERLPWLVDALASGAPSSKHSRSDHDEYQDALNRAVDGDPATDDAVRELRGKL